MLNLISAYLASKSKAGMDVDTSTLGQHVFQIDILGMQGEYSWLYLNILAKLILQSYRMNTTSQLQMKKLMLHSFIMVSLELLYPNLQLHLHRKL